jgi:hypothetical protein
MSGLRCRSAWFMDTWHDRPKLFRGGADSDCDGDHRSICHLNRDGDSDRRWDQDCDGDSDRYRGANGDGDCDRWDANGNGQRNGAG